MTVVYVVQELRKPVCPYCGNWRLHKYQGSFVCEGCKKPFEKPVSVPKYDLTPASIYGPMEVLLRTNNVGLSLQPIVAEFKRKLKDYSDDDYILATGDPIAIGIAVSVAAKNNRGRVNLLKWDRQTRQYVKATAEM